MISARRVGSMRSSWRQCRVRYQEAQGLLKEKLFKGIGSKSEVSTGAKHNIKIRVANGSWSGSATVPKIIEVVPKWVTPQSAIVYRKPFKNLRNSAGALRRPKGRDGTCRRNSYYA